MTSVKDGDDKDYDTYHKIISEILNLCTDGCTEQNRANTSITRSAKKNHGRNSRQRVITLY